PASRPTASAPCAPPPSAPFPARFFSRALRTGTPACSCRATAEPAPGRTAARSHDRGVARFRANRPGRASAARAARPARVPARGPGFVLPPPPQERGPRRSGLSVVVTRFRVTGATVFSESELQQVLAPWTGRRLGDEDLEEARRAITARYVAAGYINSGAVIP